MTGAQGWTLLGLVGVLLSVIGGLLVNQTAMLRGYLDARFDAVQTRFDGVDQRFELIDQRFDRVDQRFDHLDRDVQTLAEKVFPRE